MASYGSVGYYQEEVEKAKQRLELIEEGGKSIIEKMALSHVFDFDKIRQICDQIDSAKFSIKYAEDELQAAMKKAAEEKGSE